MYFHIKDTCVCCAGCAMDCPAEAITRKGDRYVICPVGAVQMVKKKDLDTNE